MIIYDLICDNRHTFEAWFADARDYETQLQQGLLACPHCSSRALSKIPSGGRFMRHGRGDAGLAKAAQARRELMDSLRAHARDVGRDFPEMARRIHYGEAKAEPIYGQATLQEALELHEEGVEILPVGPGVDELQ